MGKCGSKSTNLFCPMIDEYITGALSDIGGYAVTALNVITLRVAVRGLSRAGKTVFLKSLIHNLLTVGGMQGRSRMTGVRSPSPLFM